MRGTWSIGILVAALAGLVGVGGCHKGTPTTCKGWAKLLKSPVRSRDAIKGLGDLGNNCKEYLPALEEVFPTSQFKDEILQTVKAINAPQESVSLLTKALRNPRTATLAAAVEPSSDVRSWPRRSRPRSPRTSRFPSCGARSSRS